MAKHKYVCYLSEKSFEDTANEIHKYIEDFKRKCEQFGLQLTLHGYSVSKTIVTGIPYDEKGQISVDVRENRLNGVFEGYISINGEQAVFIEFGSGVTYNPSASGSFHPKADQFGFQIDTYNPDGKANIKGWDGSNATNPKGWYTPEGEHTYGTHTYMPLEYGMQAMITDITTITRRVFG